MAKFTIEGSSIAEIVEKKSRFIAHLQHVETDEEAVAFVNRIRQEHADARHNVYAYLLSSGRTRYSDDGEPPSSSGKPTISTLEHANLVDVACVTTRYFGGTLLGIGGLVRAYTQAAQAAIEAACVKELVKRNTYQVSIDYSLHDQIKRAMDECGGMIAGTDYSDCVLITFQVSEEDEEALLKRITAITKGTACSKVDA